MYPIDPEILKFLPYVHFFKDFQYKTFKDLLCFEIAILVPASYSLLRYFKSDLNSVKGKFVLLNKYN